MSSPEKRLTLSQVYDWMVQNIPYFKDKGDSNSSAGWKVSLKLYLFIASDSTLYWLWEQNNCLDSPAVRLVHVTAMKRWKFNDHRNPSSPTSHQFMVTQSSVYRFNPMKYLTRSQNWILSDVTLQTPSPQSTVDSLSFSAASIQNSIGEPASDKFKHFFYWFMKKVHLAWPSEDEACLSPIQLLALE